MAERRRIISADSHVREPFELWANAISDKLGDRTPRIVQANDSNGTKRDFFFTGGRNGKVLRPHTKGLNPDEAKFLINCGFDPATRLEFQDRAGIEAEIIFPTTFLAIMQAGDPEVVEASAEVYNDWLAEFCSQDQNRLVGVPAIPMYNVDWALAEVDRLKNSGLRGVMINAQSPEGALPYRNSHYDAFWAKAQDMDATVWLHIVTGRAIDPLVYAVTKEDMAEGAQGILDVWNEVQGVLANEFIFGTIFDRFPKLKVAHAEYEISWIPHFMYRLDQMQSDLTALLQLSKLEMKASDYIKNRVWHGVIDDPMARQAIAAVGAGHILWGSDFPHVRSVSFDTEAALDSLLGDLGAADQRMIAAENTAGIMGL